MAETAERARRAGRPAPEQREALFVVVSEDKKATDVRFIGSLTDATSARLPDVVRQIMRRSPSFLHLDLRQVDGIDESGVARLAHGVRICRRHGAMVKVSANPMVESAVDVLGVTASLGLVPPGLRDRLDAPMDGDGDARLRRQAPRY